jgi:hypothetical protein
MVRSHFDNGICNILPILKYFGIKRTFQMQVKRGSALAITAKEAGPIKGVLQQRFDVGEVVCIGIFTRNAASNFLNDKKEMHALIRQSQKVGVPNVFEQQAPSIWEAVENLFSKKEIKGNKCSVISSRYCSN